MIVWFGSGLDWRANGAERFDWAVGPACAGSIMALCGGAAVMPRLGGNLWPPLRPTVDQPILAKNVPRTRFFAAGAALGRDFRFRPIQWLLESELGIGLRRKADGAPPL